MEMRKKALKASIALIKELSVIDRLGKLFYLWHATYCLVEAGICLLVSMVTAMESSRQEQTHLEGEDISILTRYLKTLPLLLEKILRRWVNITQHASAMGALSLSVSEKLHQWASGHIIESSGLDALKETFSQSSRFSPFSLNLPPAEEGRIETVGHELLPAPGYIPTGFSEIGVLPMGAQSFSPGSLVLDSELDNSFSMLPDIYGFDNGDSLMWNFAGMDYEEVFAGLLEGEQGSSF
ncbi:uncharacterized protein LY89DRAFT_157763 [Mollisia scopiformis]|uniref:Uncharacterized protein n=1 Tax=Mollisia scopiformis TaxID=149040 RepID=A0A194X0A2_MOLSC|nr:uncharacterized protein LY89DRAFT_157763 [Mollisia scopiformis]KUJ13384.1 hypothetical protein LY89DRAFT_157763 [Mollisia scopiformis]